MLVSFLGTFLSMLRCKSPLVLLPVLLLYWLHVLLLRWLLVLLLPHWLLVVFNGMLLVEWLIWGVLGVNVGSRLCLHSCFKVLVLQLHGSQCLL